MWQRDFADVTELRTLRWGDYARLSRWSQYNHKDPRKREARGPQTEDNVTIKERQRQGLEGVTLLALELSNGATNNSGSLRKLEKTRKQIIP